MPPDPDPVVDDAARRFAAAVNAVLAFHGPHGWIIISLADGSCDYTVYDSRGDAARHVRDVRWSFIFCMAEATAGITDKIAARILRFARTANESGFARFTDPDAKDGGGDLIMPSPLEYYERQLGQLEAR